MGCCYHSQTHEKPAQICCPDELSPTEPPLRNGALYHNFSKVRCSRHLSIKKGALSSNYTVTQIIGEGAYGTVRKAICKTTQAERAVKSLLKTFVTKSSFMFSEVEILRSLDHPNILRIFEVIEDKRYYHIVTALCTGGELLDRILSAQALSENTAGHYFQQVISAVMHCHSHGILHRDIKPENLLLQDPSAGAPLIVIDFGLSKACGASGSFRRCATPYYQAPEALDGRFGKPSDIWSCGVVLYLMLCGFLPFPGASDAEVARRITRSEVDFSAHEWQSVSSEAKELLRRMLDKDPEKRPTAEEVLSSEWVRVRSRKVMSDKVFCVDAFEKLYKFRASLRLTHAVLEFVAGHYSAKEELQQLQRVFLTFDANGDGMLSREELINGIKMLELPHLDAEEIVAQCDVNGNNHVDYTEFLTACANWHHLLTSEKLQTVFCAFDIDGSKFIDMQELKLALGGEELASEGEWLHIMNEVDLNGDGLIDYHEFESALLQRGKVAQVLNGYFELAHLNHQQYGTQGSEDRPGEEAGLVHNVRHHGPPGLATAVLAGLLLDPPEPHQRQAGLLSAAQLGESAPLRARGLWQVLADPVFLPRCERLGPAARGSAPQNRGQGLELERGHHAVHDGEPQGGRPHERHQGARHAGADLDGPARAGAGRAADPGQGPGHEQGRAEEPPLRLLPLGVLEGPQPPLPHRDHQEEPQPRRQAALPPLRVRRQHGGDTQRRRGDHVLQRGPADRQEQGLLLPPGRAHAHRQGRAAAERRGPTQGGLGYEDRKRGHEAGRPAEQRPFY